MQQQSIQDLIVQYLDLLKRGKYFVIVPLALSIFLGTSLAFNLPKIYRSEVKIFYMQTQLPDWAQLEVVNMYLEAMLVFIEAMALSPSNVNNLINELDLYPELEGRLASSNIIAKFKESYNFEYNYQEVPSKYGKTEEIITGFTFSFDHENSRKSYYVVNALATSFIEYFRKFREASSAQGETFFEAERERLRREIALVDQRISEFKQKHVSELPELFQLNYRMADGIANQLFELDQKLMFLRSQKNTLEIQLSTMSPQLGLTGLSGDRIVAPEERLVALQAELGQLRARYSDRHPDVRRAQNEIAELEALVAQKESAKDKNGGQAETWTSGTAAFNPVYTQTQIQLAEIKADIETLKVKKIEYESELKEYQRRVGMTPLVEKEWLILARDRESAEKRFNDLASQVQTMESAAEMEKRELGGRLSIGQPPVIPLSPYKPNIPIIIAVSIFLGLLTGVGLLLGWDYLYKTVRTSQDLMPLSSMGVLVELPMVVAEGEGARLRVNRVYVRVALLVLFIGVVVAFDIFYMKVDVLVIKILNLVTTKFALTGL